MKLYPVSLVLEDKPVVVVGGGKVALRKVRALLEAGARVTVISQQACEEIADLGREGIVDLKVREYRTGDLEGAVVAVSATDSRETNEQAARDARDAGILINVVDVPPLCDFYVPAVLKRGDLQIAVSTGGGSPALAASIRQNLEGIFGPEYAQLLEMLAEAREWIKRQGTRTMAERKALFEEILKSPVLELIREGKQDEARDVLESCISRSSD